MTATEARQITAHAQAVGLLKPPVQPKYSAKQRKQRYKANQRWRKKNRQTVRRWQREWYERNVKKGI